MPRLSRTAKYADLRAQLANDKEEKIESNDLSSYQDRLNNVQDTLSFSTQEVKDEPKVETQDEYVWKPFEGDTFSQEVETIKPWEPAVEETKTFEEVKIEEPIQEELPAFEQPVQEETQPEQTSSYFDSFMNESTKEETKSSDFSSYFENFDQPVQEKQTIEEIYSDVFDDVKDNSGEIVNIKERDSYLNQTFSDVNAYNINNNQPTINTIVEDSVNAVRHPEDAPETTVKFEEPVQEEPADNTYAWTSFIDETKNEEAPLDADNVEEEPQIDDEEFSNTVSMEITKIMDEIANIPEEPIVIPEPVVEEKVEEPVIQETIQINETIAEEKPEEVVEIKNISEIKDEPAKDTMSSTIPFIVAAEDEALVDEDDEEDGSNTVLNVILIVLIVVLVAVLGLIVFYILKTKGIF